MHHPRTRGAVSRDVSLGATLFLIERMGMGTAIQQGQGIRSAYPEIQQRHKPLAGRWSVHTDSRFRGNDGIGFALRFPVFTFDLSPLNHTPTDQKSPDLSGALPQGVLRFPANNGPG